jgi:beta-glucosidase
MHLGNTVEALRQRLLDGTLTYEIGYDVEGTPVPASALSLTQVASADVVAPPRDAIDFVGARALRAGSSVTWTGTITAPVTGDYVLKLQTAGGRGTISLDPPPAPGAAAQPPAAGAGRGGRGGGRGGGGGASLLATADGLTNSSTPVHLDAGIARPITITATAGEATPLQIRLAWLTPTSADNAIARAAIAARAAHTAVVFAYDEGQEGRDRASLSLPGSQDALIAAVAAANPRTIVVLNNGAPVLMPWVRQVPAILQLWYPGQEGADATAALLTGDAAPRGKLPVTFPKRLEDAPTNTPERYPGVDGHGQYSEGIYLGYRWYDEHAIEPLFPFGHGLSYTEFAYSDLAVAPSGGGYDVTFTVKNAGAREGIEIAQVYVGRPPAPPAAMAERQLAGFASVPLKPGGDQRVVIHLSPRELSYWSTADHRWVVAPGPRAIMVGASSRDIRLRADVTVK